MTFGFYILLFIIYMLHIFLIDQRQIRKIEDMLYSMRFPRIAIYSWGIIGIAYILMWVWIVASFSAFIDKLFKFSSYDILFEILITVFLAFIAYILSIKIK